MAHVPGWQGLQTPSKDSKPKEHQTKLVRSKFTPALAGGDEQPVLPLLDAYLLEGQRWHCTDPACGENVPPGHWTAAVAAIGADAKEPAGTIVHDDDPELVKNPGLQGAHCCVAIVGAL